MQIETIWCMIFWDFFFIQQSAPEHRFKSCFLNLLCQLCLWISTFRSFTLNAIIGMLGLKCVILFYVFNLFSSCCLEWVISIVLFPSSLILSSVLSVLFLSPFNWFFNLNHYFFSFKIPIWYFITEIFYFFVSVEYVCNCLLKHFCDSCFKILTFMLLT